MRDVNEVALIYYSVEISLQYILRLTICFYTLVSITKVTIFTFTSVAAFVIYTISIWSTGVCSTFIDIYTLECDLFIIKKSFMESEKY